jgi:hypothetical protein
VGGERKLYRVLVEEPEGKRPLGRPRHRGKNGIRMDLRHTDWGCGEDPMAPDGDRWRALVNAVMNCGFWRELVTAQKINVNVRLLSKTFQLLVRQR